MTFPHDNLAGPCTFLDDKLIETIISAIPDTYIMKHIANIAKINYKTLYHWMTRGDKDIQSGIEDSIYAKLYRAYQNKLSECLRDKLEFLATCPKNYGAITWILEKCFKDDFETKSEAHKQLEDYVLNVIRPMMAKGDIANGGQKAQEVHQESHQTSGSPA